MALSEEPLSIVEQWNKKSFEMSAKSNDSIVSLLSRGIDTMAVVINKTSDFDRIQRALSILEYERSLSIQFDKIKNDEVRSLVYGQIECLHFALNELTKQRNQVKECGEVFTQTDQELAEPLKLSLLSDQWKESTEMFTQTDQELSQPSLDLLSSNEYADQSRDEPIIPNLLEYPKEEVFDESAFKIANLWGDEMDIKDEEMFNDDMEINNANGDMAQHRGDISNIVDNDGRAQSEMSALDYMGDEPHFENENVDETMNYSNDNENGEENREEDGEKISSGTDERENKRRSSRNVSRPVTFTESLDNSDEDSEPVMKKSKAESLKMKNKRSSGAIGKKGGLASSKGIPKQLKCPECKFQRTSATSFVDHLRRKHSTTLVLAGLALRCDCGVESLSDHHGRECDIANFTVVRKRDGPIKTFNDEKTTPQCILCEAYPKTAIGYLVHLYRHHKTTASANGIWLLCECGAKYRQMNPDSRHNRECTRLVYTLHKIADE